MNKLTGFNTAENRKAILATLVKAGRKLEAKDHDDPLLKALEERLATKTVALASIHKQLREFEECGIGLADARVAMLSSHGVQLQQDLENLADLV